MKPNLDNGKPVTITLIADSNNADLGNMGNHHRVVAYAYETRGLCEGEYVYAKDDGMRNDPEYRAKVTVVTVRIYDSNFPRDNDVTLTFKTGTYQHGISLKHNRMVEVGEDPSFYHGFFLDDANRSYRSSSDTFVRNVRCDPKEIISRDRAIYDLKFSYGCRFIPYFLVQVNGGNWRYNAAPNAAKYM